MATTSDSTRPTGTSSLDVDEASIRLFPICGPCVRAEGSECHTPGCAFWLHDVPSEPLNEDLAAPLDLLDDDRLPFDRHVGRSWTGHDIEDVCPCPKAPCGLAIFNGDPDCPQHGFRAAKTIRQGHDAIDCPAERE